MKKKQKSKGKPIVKNYGFLWERKYIDRGSPGPNNPGSLKGFHKSRDTARDTAVDFKEQMGVYTLYDETKSIVYIGQAGNGNATLFGRLKQHMDGGDLWNRWQYFSWIGFREVTQKGLSNHQDAKTTVSIKYSQALNEIEGVLIEMIEPKLNKQGGKLKDADEYFQWFDPEISLKDIKNEVSEIKELLISP